jgi:hypothetical protein
MCEPIEWRPELSKNISLEEQLRILEGRLAAGLPPSPAIGTPPMPGTQESSKRGTDGQGQQGTSTGMIQHLGVEVLVER